MFLELVTAWKKVKGTGNVSLDTWLSVSTLVQRRSGLHAHVHSQNKLKTSGWLRCCVLRYVYCQLHVKELMASFLFLLWVSVVKNSLLPWWWLPWWWLPLPQRQKVWFHFNTLWYGATLSTSVQLCAQKVPSPPASYTDLSLGKHSHEPLPIFGEGDHRGGSPRPLGILNHFRNLALHHCHTRVGGPKINPNYCSLHLRTAWKDRGKSCDEYRSTHSKCRLIPGPSSTFSLWTVGTCRAGSYTGVSIDKQQECCGNLVWIVCHYNSCRPLNPKHKHGAKKGFCPPPN